ncbi:MAG: FAD-dependent oxidoreductase [Gammaproteobacteria bacterium]|nr:FAD-dependent oxidoreductase [Gammaproteobacteria bacterium]
MNLNLRRREILAGLIGVGSTALVHPVLCASSPLRVGVVGGGIVGASIAMHLAQAGAKVMVFEKVGPAQGATQNSFAWVNAFVDDTHYRTLRIQSLLAYRELDKTLSLNMVWGGYVNWASTVGEAQVVRSSAAQLAGTPYPVRAITADEFAKLDPKVTSGVIAEAIYSSIDAHLDPVFVTRKLLDAAARAGAKTLYPCELTALEVSAGRLRGVVTSQGKFPLDRLVVAAGVDTPRVLAMAGFPLTLKHAPGILAHSASLPSLSRLVHDAPGGLSFKQMTDGSVVGTDAPDPPDIPAHQGIRAQAEQFPTDALRNYHGNRILTKIGKFLPGAQCAQLDRLTLGFRPMPADEFPVMGALPGLPDLHVAVTHSGVTLAPLIGRLTAGEVLHGSRAGMFAPYRPERFA